MELNPRDLRIDLFGSQRGFQRVGIDTGVRIKHLPTGITVECNDDRSQFKNRQTALELLEKRVKEYDEQCIEKYGRPIRFAHYDAFDMARKQVEKEMEGFLERMKSIEFESKAVTEKDDRHPDDIAVDNFAEMMKAKLARARAKGRGGWDNPDECTVENLADLLVEHVDKGDPVDVANLAMMLTLRGVHKGTLPMSLKKFIVNRITNKL